MCNCICICIYVFLYVDTFGNRNLLKPEWVTTDSQSILPSYASLCALLSKSDRLNWKRLQISCARQKSGAGLIEKGGILNWHLACLGQPSLDMLESTACQHGMFCLTTLLSAHAYNPSLRVGSFWWPKMENGPVKVLHDICSWFIIDPEQSFWCALMMVNLTWIG